jgi:hypothetical protein
VCKEDVEKNDVVDIVVNSGLELQLWPSHKCFRGVCNNITMAIAVLFAHILL